jgi:hypothetical protein
MQHQPRFNNNEQSAHQHTQALHPKSPGLGDTGHMLQSTYGLNINLLNTVIWGGGGLLYKIGNWTSTGVRHCVA